MPEKSAIRRAHKDASEGKSPSTQAGEFVREEVHHIREGVHGARSAKQAIAIGLSKARRAGIALRPKPGSDANPAAARRQRRRSRAASRAQRAHPTANRVQSVLASRSTRSERAPRGRFADGARASRERERRVRGSSSLHAAAAKAVATKGKTGLRTAAKKAAATRRRGR